MNSNNDLELNWTGERYLPWMEIGEIHYEHLHRYNFAKNFVKNKVVLDLGCGEGYGCLILSENATKVIGIDISQPSIQHAKKKYLTKNLEFLEGSIYKIPIEQEHSFDVITCFETIEHVEEQELVFDEIKRMLKPNGLLIISTPNTKSFTDDERSPFHKKELTYEEFVQLLQNKLQFFKLFNQNLFLGSNIWQNEDSENFKEYLVKQNNKEYLSSNKSQKESKFFIALASNEKINPNLLFDSYFVDVQNMLLKEKNQYIQKISKTLKEKDIELGNVSKTLKEKSQTIDELSNIIKQKNYELIDVQDELNQIQKSILFKNSKKISRMIDHLFPESTKRGNLKKISALSYNIIDNEGIRHYLYLLKRQIKRRQFSIPEPIFLSDSDEENLKKIVKENKKKRLTINQHSKNEIKNDEIFISKEDDF